ncbi:RNA polymerase sigma factor [Flavobacteriaceae bacterium M23B6Z8]
MTDQMIITQLEKGNEVYLKYLYEHLDMVKSWVLQNNGNEEDALDVFQEAIIVFYRKIKGGSYEAKSKISTYLFSICKRQWYNQLNRRLKYEKPNGSVYSIDKRQEDFDPEITHRFPTLKKYMEKALDKLGEPCKSLLFASVCSKLKMQEIAVQFNYADAHSARQQKLRCMKKLRSYVSYEEVIRLQ